MSSFAQSGLDNTAIEHYTFQQVISHKFEYNKAFSVCVCACVCVRARARVCV